MKAFVSCSQGANRNVPLAELIESCEQLVQDLHELAGAVGGGDGGEADDVRIEDRHILVPRHIDLLELRVQRGAEVLSHLHRYVLGEDAEEQPLLLGALLLDHQLNLQALSGLEESSALLEFRQGIAGSA